MRDLNKIKKIFFRGEISLRAFRFLIISLISLARLDIFFLERSPNGYGQHPWRQTLLLRLDGPISLASELWRRIFWLWLCRAARSTVNKNRPHLVPKRRRADQARRANGVRVPGRHYLLRDRIRKNQSWRIRRKGMAVEASVFSHLGLASVRPW